MALEKIITEEYLDEYANASEELNNYLTKDFNKKRTIVIPSRGAYIFYDIALDDITFSIFGRDFGSTLDVLGKFYFNMRHLVLPYTYDNSYIKELSSKDIRNYWVKVTKDDIFRSNKKNLELKFHNYLYENLIATKKIKELELMFDRNNSYYKNLFPEKYKDNILFIDTAISGRTISELISCFKAENFFPEIFLIVEGNEKENKLRGKYKKEIYDYIGKYGGKIVYVSKLFTEDNSPALLGATSIIFPQFTENLKKKTGLTFGAGIWKKPSPDKIERSIYVNEILDITAVRADEIYTSYLTLKNLISYYYNIKNNFDFKEYVLPNFKREYNRLERLLFEKNLLEKDKVIKVYEDLLHSLLLEPKEISINSSFVINLFFDEKKVDELVDKFIYNNNLKRRI